MARIKTAEELRVLRRGGAQLARILRECAARAVPGVRTSELDDYARARIAAIGGTPSFLGYQPEGYHERYPAALCVSINEEVVHGIPGMRELVEGDVLGLDLGLQYEGLYTDAARSVPVGTVSAEARALLAATQEALAAGIAAARAGNTVGDIGAAVAHVAKLRGFTIVRDLTGHGVGHAVHETPLIPNEGKEGKGERLVPGMVIAIEPMLTVGNGEIALGRDGFTLHTSDGTMSAHYEHTVAITNEGPRILTA